MPDNTTACLSQHLASERAADRLLPLKVSNLVWSAGGRHIVNGINLTLSDGGITAVMGPNGAGKSVLIRLLHGLLEPDAGTISWNGDPAGPASRARQAMVFQKPVLLRRSVAANIDFVLKLTGKADTARRDDLLERAGLADKARQPARALSGGEQQRLALVRALASNPDVLFLDEPTASLDPSSTAAIEAMITDARQRGIKVLLVTHDIGQARRLAHDVVFVNRGQVSEHTPASTFFTKPASTQARDYLAGKLVL
ncbi:MAG: phosphate ABC transporter ATP-binding protein [Anderseniella sp.]|nr:phosphate ABC transporter ATP-binding protein [Anderseniella sp.]